MIPKIIHYCWFGRGEKPKLAQMCIASWRKYCPDYKIIEWNENNFDVDQIDYTKFTYEHRLYAYLSDYVRLWAVEKYGGFYFDTDVELIKPLQRVQVCEAFFGFETEEYVNTGIGFGAIAHHPVVKAMQEEYEKLASEELIQTYQQFRVLTGSPKMNTKALVELGLKKNGERQQICGAEIFPKDFFCPFDDPTGELRLTENSISIHWYLKSAHGKYAVTMAKLKRPIRRIIKGIRNRL